MASPSALGFAIGQEIQIKYYGTDPVTGFMRLSRKAATNLSGVVTNLDKSESQ